MKDPVSAVLLDDTVLLSLAELCTLCRVTEELVVEIVAEGIVEPNGASRGEWRFSGVAIARIQRVARLQHDFGVNVPGAALALDQIGRAHV